MKISTTELLDLLHQERRSDDYDMKVLLQEQTAKTEKAEKERDEAREHVDDFARTLRLLVEDHARLAARCKTVGCTEEARAEISRLRQHRAKALLVENQRDEALGKLAEVEKEIAHVRELVALREKSAADAEAKLTEVMKDAADALWAACQERDEAKAALASEVEKTKLFRDHGGRLVRLGDFVDYRLKDGSMFTSLVRGLELVPAVSAPCGVAVRIITGHDHGNVWLHDARISSFGSAL